MTNLTDRVVLITGACGTIGQACVSVLHEENARIFATDMAPWPGEKAGPDTFEFRSADVTRDAEIEQLFAAALDHYGRIDAAILAAGIEGPVAPVEETTEGELDIVLSVNVKGTFLVVQHCLRHMKPRRSGSIVAVSSISGVVGTASMAAYTISKHAVIGLVRATAIETGPHGIRVNAVCPGPVESEMMSRIDQAFLQREPDRLGGSVSAAKSLPLQKYVTPTDVARMSAFLCSDASASCHGGAYLVDGGFTAK